MTFGVVFEKLSNEFRPDERTRDYEGMMKQKVNWIVRVKGINVKMRLTILRVLVRRDEKTFEGYRRRLMPKTSTSNRIKVTGVELSLVRLKFGGLKTKRRKDVNGVLKEEKKKTSNFSPDFDG